MRKFTVLLMALLITGMMVGGAFAAEGDEFSVTSFRIDGNGEMLFKNNIEITSTNDTVTAAESGKVFIASTGGGYDHIKWTLPTADDGLIYKFIQQGSGTLIEIEPAATDQLLYSTAGTGDRLVGPATVGASITVSSSDDTVWFVEANGTFTIQAD